MTTTQLIKLLESVEHGASGRPREISFSVNKKIIFEPYIQVDSTGDGIMGAELTLRIMK